MPLKVPRNFGNGKENLRLNLDFHFDLDFPEQGPEFITLHKKPPNSNTEIMLLNLN